MKYITFLRGINVSGKNKIKMADLRAMCEKMGYRAVQTYIQSGNIIFETKETDLNAIEDDIHNEILKTFGYEVPVMTKTKDYIQEVIDNNPFLAKDPSLDIKLLHVTFLSAIPEESLVEKMSAIDYGTDEFEVVDDKVYLCFPNGYGRTKLTNNTFESKLKVAATTRNWRTTNKVIEY